MALLSLPSLSFGARVQHELLVRERTEKKMAATGEPFVILTLGNRSGQIDTAPIWPSQMEWADGADRGKIVQAIGEVAPYEKNGQLKRQLKLTAPLRVLPAEQFNPEEFLPHVDEDLDVLWSALDRARNTVRSETLRRVLQLVFGDDDFRTRFERAPGSTNGHHAKMGGLLQHTLEVARIAVAAAKTVRRANEDLVVVGALLHDIGKVEAYEIGAGGFTHTPCGLLVGHVVLGILMLERRLAAFGKPLCSDAQLVELQHLILSHHGKLEFGSPVEPMTVEAEIVHRADEASAKATDFLDALDDPDLWADGADTSKRSWRLGRRVYRRSHDWD
ncbi:3'-5' exoribonuclease YhaM family protein [Gemmatirosa kalamazoonensis]|nr:HD domain-containing protein [Gemmatirosa kalamazoonensis]